MLKICQCCGSSFLARNNYQRYCGTPKCNDLRRQKYYDKRNLKYRMQHVKKEKDEVELVPVRTRKRKQPIISHEEILNQAREEHTSYGKIVANEYIKQNPMERCEQYYIDHGMEVKCGTL